MVRTPQLKRLLASLSSPAPGNAPSLSRRQVLLGAAGLAAVAAVGSGNAYASGGPRVVVLGAGLAGLAAADRLRKRGVAATIFEAAYRVGGRCQSLRGFFPGQVAELGGEFIDTAHKTMIGFAREFKLKLEDVGKQPGEPLYRFFGQTYRDPEVVAEFRVLAKRMQADLKASSGAPTAFSNNEADRNLDAIDLRTYLATRGEGLPLIQAVLNEAYLAEYGLEPEEQSCLNLLLFIKLSQRSKFQPFGVFSDERYHVREGNDGIAQGLASRLPGPIELGCTVKSIGRLASGELEIEFWNRGPVRADHVICTLPFTVLRNDLLRANLDLPAAQRTAVNELGYGANAKTMVSISGRTWQAAGSNGTAYSDLESLQTCWETNPANAGATTILTDYASGNRGAFLESQSVPDQVESWLTDVDQVFPGTSAAAVRDSSGPRAVRRVWTSDPLALGSYTCYLPGQFTQVAGWESVANRNLHFAGEHADSFYSWQGFMEGACLSGIRAANEVLQDL